MSKLIDLTNQEFGYWKVESRAKNRQGGRTYWNCLCTACGNRKEVSGSHLRGGRTTNCGCIRMEKMRQASIKHEEGKIYGFLEVIREATVEERPRQDRTGVYWNCKCNNCGKENVIIFGDYLRNGDTTSCGCIQSKNESKISQMLDLSNINYIKEYSFPNLYSARTCDKLYFDFAILNNDQLLYLIEYDGIQHFDSEGKHWGSKENYLRTHENDLLKNKYCFERNIPLIRIPYNKDYNLKDLKIETTRYLLTKTNEKEYYTLKN